MRVQCVTKCSEISGTLKQMVTPVCSARQCRMGGGNNFGKLMHQRSRFICCTRSVHRN